MSDLQKMTDAVRGRPDNLGTNITLDTTGVPALIAQAVAMTATMGKVCRSEQRWKQVV